MMKTYADLLVPSVFIFLAVLIGVFGLGIPWIRRGKP
jgi:hypothetical protein